MFEKAKKQLSVITGPSHREDESHTNNGSVCHSLKQAKPRAKNTPRPQTEAI